MKSILNSICFPLNRVFYLHLFVACILWNKLISTKVSETELWNRCKNYIFIPLKVFNLFIDREIIKLLLRGHWAHRDRIIKNGIDTNKSIYFCHLIFNLYFSYKMFVLVFICLITKKYKWFILAHLLLTM